MAFPPNTVPPTIRAYVQAMNVLSTDAFIIDRIGTGTMYVNAGILYSGIPAVDFLYDIAMNYPSAPIPSSIFLSFVTLRPYTLGVNCVGSDTVPSRAVFTTGPSSPLTITISKNGVSFGTLSFAATYPTAAVGTFSTTAEAFALDDILELSVGAANFGATNLVATFNGTRT